MNFLQHISASYHNINQSRTGIPTHKSNILGNNCIGVYGQQEGISLHSEGHFENSVNFSAFERILRER